MVRDLFTVRLSLVKLRVARWWIRYLKRRITRRIRPNGRVNRKMTANPLASGGNVARGSRMQKPENFLKNMGNYVDMTPLSL